MSPLDGSDDHGIVASILNSPLSLRRKSAMMHALLNRI